MKLMASLRSSLLPARMKFLHHKKLDQDLSNLLFAKLPQCRLLTQTQSSSIGTLWRISYSYNQDNYSNTDNDDQTSRCTFYNTNSGMMFKTLSPDSMCTGCQDHILNLKILAQDPNNWI